MRILKLSVLIAILAIGFFSLKAEADSGLIIGVLAKRGSQKTIEKWGATAEFLSKRLKRNVRIAPLTFEEIEQALKENQIDFLLANSAFFAKYKDRYKLRAVVTMVNSNMIAAAKKFGGVIFTRKNRKINSIEDIRNKKLMCVNFSSFGGAHAAWRLLLEHGIDPRKDCAAFLEGGTHDNVVMAVKNGSVDVGTVRSDTLERMEREGKIRIGDFKIINPINDGFPFIHSTILYPEWPLAATPKIEPKLANKAGSALMSLDAGHPALVASKVYSWTYAADYSEVVNCLQIIGQY
jgi:two-component system sensor histidine kinase TtrS